MNQEEKDKLIKELQGLSKDMFKFIGDNAKNSGGRIALERLQEAIMWMSADIQSEDK